jgi:putative lipoic acid-binding regulatory protein
MAMPPLDDLMEFPASYTFRALAATLPGLPQACAKAVETALGRTPDKVSVQPSSKGKWTSVRVTAQVHSAEEVLAAYTALKALDGVKMTL